MFPGFDNRVDRLVCVSSLALILRQSYENRSKESLEKHADTRFQEVGRPLATKVKSLVANDKFLAALATNWSQFPTLLLPVSGCCHFKIVPKVWSEANCANVCILRRNICVASSLCYFHYWRQLICILCFYEPCYLGYIAQNLLDFFVNPTPILLPFYQFYVVDTLSSLEGLLGPGREKIKHTRPSPPRAPNKASVNERVCWCLAVSLLSHCNKWPTHLWTIRCTNKIANWQPTNNIVLFMTGIPSGELLLMLSENITNDWYDLGIYLHLQFGPLDGIRDNAQFCRPKDKALEMFKLWLKGNGDSATVGLLAEALGKAKRHDLVRRLQTRVQYTAVVIRICRISCMPVYEMQAFIFNLRCFNIIYMWWLMLLWLEYCLFLGYSGPCAVCFVGVTVSRIVEWGWGGLGYCLFLGYSGPCAVCFVGVMVSRIVEWGGADLDIVFFSGIRTQCCVFCRGYGESNCGVGVGRLGHCGDLSGFFFSGCDAVALAWRLSLILHSHLTCCRMDVHGVVDILY